MTDNSQAPPFSRCDFASEFCFTLVRKPFQRPPHIKKGGGAPISASTGVRPAAATKACLRMRRAPSLRSTRTARDLRSGTLASRRSTAANRRGPDLNSAPDRASWNHRIQTGVPSRHQCSEHLAVRSRAGRDDAQNRPEPRCIAALPGTALVPLSKVPSRKALRERDREDVIDMGTDIKGLSRQ